MLTITLSSGQSCKYEKALLYLLRHLKEQGFSVQLNTAQRNALGTKCTVAPNTLPHAWQMVSNADSIRAQFRVDGELFDLGTTVKLTADTTDPTVINDLDDLASQIARAHNVEIKVTVD